MHICSLFIGQGGREERREGGWEERREGGWEGGREQAALPLPASAAVHCIDMSNDSAAES